MIKYGYDVREMCINMYRDGRFGHISSADDDFVDCANVVESQDEVFGFA